MTQNEIQQYVYDYLYDKGLPHQTIVAIMGNITAESGWDVTCIEQGTGVGFGLCQWSYGRRDTLEAYGTSLECQCDFLWSELTGENTSITGASLQWIANPADSVTPDTSYIFALSDFLAGNGTIEELTTAWCYCWERPAYATNHLDRRIESANNFNTTMSYGGAVDENTRIISSALGWAVEIAEDDCHGYDQTNRWSPDYDCSSFVISAFKQAGMTINATYTGDMVSGFSSAGFDVIDFIESEIEIGDILLGDGHTCLYLGNNQIVHASINELGTTTGGQTGDQTGKEICVRDYYNHPWLYILRLPHTGTPTIGGGGTGGGTGGGGKDTLYDLISKTWYNVDLLNNVDVLKSLHLDENMTIKHSFNKRKTVYAVNVFNKRLLLYNKEYYIKDVAENGWIICYPVGQPLYITKVNPLYVDKV